MLRGFSIHFLVFFAVLVNSIFGLLKLQTEVDKKGNASNLLVDASLAQDDIVYLFQPPRTATTPNQAALSLFIETVIILMGIKFRRISNQFFLGSPSAGAIPFIQYNGKYIDGTAEVLKKLHEINGNSNKPLLIQGSEEEEAKIRDFAENICFKILMKDRATRKFTAPWNLPATGLDFMMADPGIVQQIMPVMPELLLKNPDGRLSLRLEGDYTVKVAFHQPEFWRAFLEAKRLMKIRYKDENNKNKAFLTHLNAVNEKMLEFVEGIKHREMPSHPFDFGVGWKMFMSEMKELMKTQLKEQFTDLKNPNSAESKLHAFLKAHIFDKEKQLSYEAASEEEIYTHFENKLKELNLAGRLEKHKFLFSRIPSVADASLYSILVQFFETPLNMGKFKKLFASGKRNDNVAELPLMQRLYRYVIDLRKELRVYTNKWWNWRKTHWQLNYEDNEEREFGDKYDGPYNIEMGELVGLENLHAVPLNDLINSEPIKDEIATNNAETATPTKAQQIKGELLVAIVSAVVKHYEGRKVIDLKRALLETAAYLCNAGKQKTREQREQCRKWREEKIAECERENLAYFESINLTKRFTLKCMEFIKAEYAKQTQETRKVIYQTILNFMDYVVGQNVQKATLEVAGMVQVLVAKGYTEAAKALASDDAVGDEQ